MAYDQPQQADVPPPPEPPLTPMEKWEAYEDKLNLETRAYLINHRDILQDKGDLNGVEATNEMIAKVEALIPEDLLAEVREPSPAEKSDAYLDQLNAETRDILVAQRDILQDKGDLSGVEGANAMIANVEALLPIEPTAGDQAGQAGQADQADRHDIDDRIADLEYQLQSATEAGDEQQVFALSLEIATLRRNRP